MTPTPNPTTPDSPVALVTGGSAGLGLALTRALADRGWAVVVDGRTPEPLDQVVADLGERVAAVRGDVADPRHRDQLVAAVEHLGRLDLLVHAASTLGPLPLRPLVELSPSELDRVWAVNAAAPLSLSRRLAPVLRVSGGAVVSLSSDAAVEHYATWGAYGATKAALDHLTLTLAAEEGIAAYAIDPGDMRTAMHQAAFPDEDISDRPLPETVVPRLLHLIDSRPPAGRYRAADLTEGALR